MKMFMILMNKHNKAPKWTGKPATWFKRYVSNSISREIAMYNTFLAIVIAISSLVAVPVHSYATEPHGPQDGIVLSPDVLNLLRTEMREIAGGVQGIALSIATADWKSIEEISNKIRASYIMEKKLTSAQAKELENALPDQFKLLDAEFHQRADKLHAAAAARDPELTLFHYSRLVESCVRCHASFADKRFSGFASPEIQGHHH
jgi:cytochrome c556